MPDNATQQSSLTPVCSPTLESRCRMLYVVDAVPVAGVIVVVVRHGAHFARSFSDALRRRQKRLGGEPAAVVRT